MRLNPTSISEVLLFSTVRLSVTKAEKDAIGTAFFFLNPKDPRRSFLVTNRHLVEGSLTGTGRFHLAGKDSLSGEWRDVTLDNFEARWTMHPNADVDLCVMPDDAFVEVLVRDGLRLAAQPIAPGMIPTQETLENLSAIEDVFMYGYPVGLFDEKHNLPLIRRGSTATHPAVDHEGKPEGVLDIACFDGSSGSPIFIIKQGAFAPPRGEIGFNVGQLVYFLGVNYGGPWTTESGDVGKLVPNEAGILELRPIDSASEHPMVSVTALMVHLASYVKAREVLALVEACR